MARSTMPAELAEIISLHRHLFGGYTMQADTAAPSEAPQEPKPDEAPPEDARDEQLGDGGKKALDAERRRARDLEKQLNAANAKLAEIDDASKSELQKATEANAKLSGEVEQLRRQQLALDVVAARGQDPRLARFLTGTSREELEASAEELASLIGSPAKAPVVRNAGQPPITVDDDKREFLRNLVGH